MPFKIKTIHMCRFKEKNGSSCIYTYKFWPCVKKNYLKQKRF